MAEQCICSFGSGQNAEGSSNAQQNKTTHATGILTLPQWEMACQAEPAATETKSRGKLGP